MRVKNYLYVSVIWIVVLILIAVLIIVSKESPVISGILVFVIGQCIANYIIKPIADFRLVLGEISAIFLREQHKIINATGSPDLQADIRRMSASLYAGMKAIPGYKFVSFMFLMPKEENVLEACWSMNGMAYDFVTFHGMVLDDIKIKQANDKESRGCYERIGDAMRLIEENLNIRISWKL